MWAFRPNERGPRDVHLDDLPHPAGAGGQHRHPVGQQHRLLHRVGDEHDRRAQLHVDALQFDRELGAGQRVQGGERLVHQQHLGPRDQGPAQRDPLLHAAGQLVRQALVEVPQADHLEQLVGVVAVGRRGASRRSRPGSRTLSSTVRHGSSAGRWNIMPTSRERPSDRRRRRSRPGRWWPAAGPAIRRSSVDLPQPDRPIAATNSPSSTSRLMSRSASTDGSAPAVEGLRDVLDADHPVVSFAQGSSRRSAATTR